LDEALSRLPEKYRDPVVLTYLEGRDREQVAVELGLTANALAVRLNRAMDKLRARLAGGGALSVAALAAFLSAEAQAGAGGAEMILAAMTAAGGKLGLAGTQAGLIASEAASAITVAKVKTCVAVSCIGLALAGGGVTLGSVVAPRLAKGQGSSATVTPVLEPDPAVTRILGSLEANQSAWLPAKKTRGDFGAFMRKHRHHIVGPGLRDYCRKWVWAPDRKRALYCGGNTGVPHKINDVWEYDLASNTWVLLWEPDPDTNFLRHVKDPAEVREYLNSFVKVDRRTGEIMTRRGAPFDPIHTWWGLTYDPEMRALLWVMGNHHLHEKFLELNPELRRLYKFGALHRMRLWAYYPAENRWQFVPDRPRGLKSSPAILEYVPKLGGSLYYSATHRQVAVFDGATRSWRGFRELAPTKREFRKMSRYPPNDAVAAWDSLRGMMVVHHGREDDPGKPFLRRTYHYDPAADRWERVLTSRRGPTGNYRMSSMTFDAAAGRCFVSADGLWTYSADERKWEPVVPDGPKAPAGMACYNHEHNVLMVDTGGERVWVYRAQKRAPAAGNHSGR
jgi:hypothetical protein